MKRIIILDRIRKLPSCKICLLVLLLSPAAPSRAGLDQLVGHYVGAWTNLTFGSTGKAIINLNVSGTNASLVFDMDGYVFGSSDPPVIAMPGTVQGEVIQIDNQGVGIFGDISGVVDGNTGTLTTTLTNIPGGSIQQVTASGTVTNGVFHIDYVVSFYGPPSTTNPAHGVMIAPLVPPIFISHADRQGPNLVLRWSGGLGPFTVQAATNLVAGGWTDIGLPTNDTNVMVSISPAGAAFFRVAGQ